MHANSLFKNGRHVGLIQVLPYQFYLMIFLCPFLHCKALRTAMYKRYINSIIIIIIIIIIKYPTYLNLSVT